MAFELVSQNEYLLLKIKGEFQGSGDTDLLAVFKEQQEKTQLKYLIIQCSECSFIGADAMREFAQIYKNLKTINGGMRLVAVNPDIEQSIKKAGLDRILSCKASLRGALVDFGLVTTKEFDVNFINPFLGSTLKVFEIQCQTKATAQKPFLKKAGDPLLLGDISGIISISSETFNGTLAISLAEVIFVKIASRMLGEEYKVIDEGNVDLIGELANIILGQAKIELAKLGYGIQMALPSCVWGKDHKIKHFGGGVCVVIPFECEFGVFHIEVMTTSIANGTGQSLAKSA